MHNYVDTCPHQQHRSIITQFFHTTILAPRPSQYNFEYDLWPFSGIGHDIEYFVVLPNILGRHILHATGLLIYTETDM